MKVPLTMKCAAARRDLFHNNCKLFFTISRKQKISQCKAHLCAAHYFTFGNAEYFTKNI